MDAFNDIFKIRHNKVLPKEGKILISEPFLRDAFFQRSVVLLAEHNDDGSMGFVLNKNTGLFLNDFVEPLGEQLKSLRIPLYMGGPVSVERLFYIHSLGDLVPDSIQIGNNLYVDGDFEALCYYLLSNQPVKGKVKFFLGYAGWTTHQLDDEIRQNSWLVGDATPRNMMLATGDTFWKKAVTSIGGSYLTWINYPKYPHLN